MPSDTVDRSYFLAVCEERDRLRQQLKLAHQRARHLQDAISQHRDVHEARGSHADRQLWGATYQPAERRTVEL